MPLSNVAEQTRAIETLVSALKHQTVHHAYLFAGPEGVGKELAAIGLAQAVNCQSQAPDSVDACGQCSSCVRIQKGNHPDIHLLMPEEEWVTRGLAGRSDFAHVPSRDIKVEQIRQLQERLVLRPLEAERKVVIVASAHAMNVQAQNAFLKTLEEPPANTLIILVSAAPDRLLATIRSRCSRVQFGPLPEAFVAAQLVKERKMEPLHAQVISAMSGGSLSAALDMDVNELEERQAIIQKFESLSSSDARGWIAWAEEMGESRETAEKALQVLSVWLRDVLVARMGMDKFVHRDLAALATQSASRHSEIALHRRRSCVDHAWTAISARHGNARLQLERMLIEMMS